MNIINNISVIRKHVFFFFTILISILSSLHPDTRFEHFTTREGLSNNTVVRILRDSRGFMWFGTPNGLNRYDGKNFNVYMHNPEDSTSLSYNHVQSIYEDRLGNLWIGTYGGGLNKFEMSTEKFTHYRHDPTGNSISSNFVLSIYEDKAGYLWIGTDNGGINRFDQKENKWKSYQNDSQNPNSLSHNIVRAIYEDKSGVLWFGTDGGGLNKFDRETEKFISYKHDPDDPRSLSHNFVLTIIEDENGIFWLATYGGGLNKFDRDTGIFSHYRHDPDNPNSLAHDVIQTIFISPTESDVIWIATASGGLDKFNIKDEKFTHFKHHSSNLGSLSTDDLYTVYEDWSGLLWVGTSGKGICKYNKVLENIVHYKAENGNFKSLNNNVVISIFEDKSGILWIGTVEGGLNKLDRKANIFTYYIHHRGNVNSLSHNQVFSIVEEKNGILWVGTREGLNRFNIRTEQFMTFRYDSRYSQSLSNNFIYRLYIDRSNNLWIGTIGGGLNKLDLNERKKRLVFTHFMNDPNDSHSISGDIITCILEDDNGYLWIGTSAAGLNNFDTSSQRFFQYKNDPHDENSISNNFITTLHLDQHNILWIGTYGGGLNRFNPNDQSFTHFQEKDGLCNNIVCGILEDDNNNLWISTISGISKFNLNKVNENGVILPAAFKNYTYDDGFQDNEFRANSYFKNSRGEMFFGGINGFNVFHPDSLIENRVIPDIYITEFNVLNKTYQSDSSIISIKKITLPYYKNFFSFCFVALDFTAPEKNQYAYKLEGLNEDWIYSGNFNFASYTDINPGKYIFRVKGSNNEGVWNEKGTSVKIIITPPWWRTKWAYSLDIIIIIGLLLLVRLYELKRLQLKHNLKLKNTEAEKLREIDQMKSRFFANISHEFRTPLTLILGPLNRLLLNDLGDETKRYLQIMNRNANHLLRLINQLLDFSKLESGTMKLQTSRCDIVSHIKGIMMSFQAIADRNNIEYHFTSEKKRLELYCDRDKTEKIFYNLLSNAFKFTPAHGEISVRVQEKLEKSGTRLVEISVSDTGTGIAQDKLPHIFDRFYQGDDSAVRAHEGSGIGLALVKELVELHRGSVRVQSEVNKGSEFTVRLPMGMDHLKKEEIVEEDLVLANPDINAEDLVDLPVDDTMVTEATISRIRRPIVLLVEDNTDMLTYIRDYLQPYYNIKVAFDGEEGVEKAQEMVPDLIISDIMMPKKDGYALCKELKKNETTSHIPIILLTAKAERKDKIEGLEVGADDYLIKPFDSKELMVRIKNLIEIRRKLRERFHREKNQSLDELGVNPVDKKFLERARTIVEENIGNEKFDVKQFCRLIGMSGTQLRRKMNALLYQSPNQFIRTIRLQKAASLIKEEMKSVSEAAYMVGFSSLSYFSKCFKEEMGVLPSEYGHDNFTL